MSIPAKNYPIRPVGGNVLLRRVLNTEVQSSLLKLVGGKDGRVLQIGEVLGLGSRWTQDAEWWPPMPVENRARAQEIERNQMRQDGIDGPLADWKPMWKTPDSFTRRKKPPAFTFGHKLALSELQVGDLVVYNAARAYDTFEFEGDVCIVYPGNWIYAIVDQAKLVEQPELREYDTTVEI